MYPQTIPSRHNFIPAMFGFAARTLESDTIVWSGQLPPPALVYLSDSISPRNVGKTVGFSDGHTE